jgi:hypothetical protein
MDVNARPVSWLPPWCYASLLHPRGYVRGLIGGQVPPAGKDKIDALPVDMPLL